jgi:hypothetical protein
MTATKLVDTSTLFPAENLGESFRGLVVSGDALVVAVGATVGSPPGTTHSDIGRIFRLPVDGRTLSLLIEITGSVNGLLATPTQIFYGDSQGYIWSLPNPPTASASISIQMPTQVAAGTPPLGELSSDGSNLYWPDQAGIHSIPLLGGTATTITAQIVSDARPVGATLLTDDAANGNVLSIPISGGSVTTLAAGQSRPANAQGCGAGDVCWFDVGAFSGPVGPIQGAAIMRRNRSGQLTTLYPANGPAELLYDGQSLFLGEGDCCTGTILRIALDGTHWDLATTNGAAPFAVDDQCLYWIDRGNGIFSQDKSLSP